MCAWWWLTNRQDSRFGRPLGRAKPEGQGIPSQNHRLVRQIAPQFESSASARSLEAVQIITPRSKTVQILFVTITLVFVY